MQVAHGIRADRARPRPDSVRTVPWPRSQSSEMMSGLHDGALGGRSDGGIGPASGQPRHERIRHLLADWPVLDPELGHREVLRVAGCEPTADGERSGRDKTIRLGQRHATGGKPPPPGPGAPPLLRPERHDAQPLEERSGSSLLRLAKAPHDFLNVDGARMRLIAGLAQEPQATDRSGPPPEQVDQDRGIE